MFIRSYILFLIIYVFAGLAALEASADPYNSNPLTEKPTSSSFDFRLVKGLIILEATVSGVSGNYILDTGASPVLVNQKVSNPDVKLAYINGDIDAQTLEVEHISIGELDYEVDDVLAADLTEVEHLIQMPIAGIIGNTVLTEYNVVIDYEWGEVTLLSKEQRSLKTDHRDYLVTSLPFSVEYDGMIILPVKVGNEEKRFLFDTGAATNVLNGIDGNQSANTFENLSLNGISIKQAPFVMTDLSIVGGQGESTVDGILSPYTLSAKKVVLDFDKKRIHFFWDRAHSAALIN